jgi:hypothetical protein
MIQKRSLYIYIAARPPGGCQQVAKMAPAPHAGDEGMPRRPATARSPATRRLASVAIVLRAAPAATPPLAATTSSPTAAAAPSAGPLRGVTEQSLTDEERDRCLDALDRDSYCVLPLRLPADIIERTLAYINGFCSDPAMYNAPEPKAYSPESPSLHGTGFQQTNIVECDPVFREFLTYKPALQLCYDVFGPMFHLGQVIEPAACLPATPVDAFL